MRKLIMLSAAAAMAAAIPVPIQADPPGRETPAEVLAFCQEQVALDPTLTLGTCVSFFLSGDEGFIAQFCHFLQDHNELDGATFDQCVREFRKGD
jgi:hypothetical protein